MGISLLQQPQQNPNWGFFDTSIYWPAVTPALATTGGSGNAKPWSSLLICFPNDDFYQWFLLCTKWFSLLSSMEVFFSPSVSRSWFSVKYYDAFSFLFLKTFGQNLIHKDCSVLLSHWQGLLLIPLSTEGKCHPWSPKTVFLECSCRAFVWERGVWALEIKFFGDRT